MPQLLADLTDINKWLQDQKIEADDANTAQYQISASRIIKSSLSGVFTPVTLFGWDSPTDTPSLIREIAGELIAAYLYRELYAEDVTDIPAYAQKLYDEAVGMLNQIKTGSLDVLDANETPLPAVTTALQEGDFYPDDSAPGPYFKMSDIFA